MSEQNKPGQPDQEEIRNNPGSDKKHETDTERESNKGRDGKNQKPTHSKE